MSKILITGGAGFLGSNLARALAKKQHDITILDDMTTGTADNIPLLPNVKVIVDTVTDRLAVENAARGQEIIFHLAARNIVSSVKQPHADLATNGMGTLNVLEAARQTGAWVVYASSASVYGNAGHLPARENDPVDLLTPYSVSKFAGEGYCRACHIIHNVPVVILRYSNIYGPRQRADVAGVVAKFTAAAISGAPLQIHGDGSQTRDYTYVSDAVEATIKAAWSPRSVGQVFNVGTGTETSVLDLAVMVSDLAPLDDVPEHIDRRDVDNIRRRAVNAEKAGRVLHWSPQVSLEAGLKKTMDWYREQVNE